MKIKKPVLILAIETSCDETSAAIIVGQEVGKSANGKKTESIPLVLSNVVSSQIDLHAKTGGVVPEVASRAHMEAIIPVIEESLLQANLKFKTKNCLKDITHIAVTVGPGLIGSLLVGFNTAKALAYALDIPIIPINHIEGHIYSALAEQFLIINNQFSNKSQIQNFQKAESQKLTPGSFPILALTVSGGHTSLTLMHNHGVYENVGQTLDDAAGEAFDKVAKLLGLGYPGGPALSRIAEQYRKTNSNNQISTTKQIPNSRIQIYNNNKTLIYQSDKGQAIEQFNNKTIILPLPLAQDPSFNFSYSGLKTAVLLQLRKAEKEYQNNPQELGIFKQKLATVFEETAVAHLVDKTLKAAKKYQVKTVLLAGGVSANKWLRQELSSAINNLAIEQSSDIHLLQPPIEMTGDNAAMIGLAAYYHVLREDTNKWSEIRVDSNMKL